MRLCQAAGDAVCARARASKRDRRLRPVAVVLDVLFARPDQLDRPLRRALATVTAWRTSSLSRAAAEAAAEEAVVDVDLLRLTPVTFGRSGERAFRVLRADPDVDAIGLHAAPCS